MPGASAFYVQPSTLIAMPPGTDGAGWVRGIPTIGLLGAPAVGNPAPPYPVADCHALEYDSPPTLRTAYDVYAVSIPWGAAIYDATTPMNVNVELALLINGEVRWIGTDNEPFQSLGYGSPAAYGAAGTINADLTNALRINPRERLSLRMGLALDPPQTIYENTIWGYVSAQVTGSAPSETVIPTQGSISYQIIDLPGSRSL
jgi:hypothetical protein